MASENTSFRDGSLAGVMLRPLKVAFTLTLMLAGILVLAWSIDWIFVSRVWPDGVERLRGLLAIELEQGVALVVRQGGDTAAIVGPANALYSFVFEASGIHAMGGRFADSSALSIPDTVVRRAYLAHQELIEAAMVGTQLLGVRFAVLLRFGPLLLLLCAIGSVDGLVERSIRRAGGGRESASLYHRAKYLQMAVLGLSGVALLVWPGVVWWKLWAGLIALVVCGLARQQWAFYKKHL